MKENRNKEEDLRDEKNINQLYCFFKLLFAIIIYIISSHLIGKRIKKKEVYFLDELMNFNSYSQYYEDLILFCIFYDIENGFYIDIGANDPNLLSVTKGFYLRGWNGINIEPLPEKYNLLLNERKRDINLQIGVGKEKGNFSLFLRGPGSTLSKIYEKEKLKILNITVDTMSNVCKKYIPKRKIIQFCKIDVEGGERDVLLGYDFKIYRPKVFCIESTKPATNIPNHEEWESILLKNDYSFAYQHRINRFYVDNRIEGLREKFKKVDKIIGLYKLIK